MGFTFGVKNVFKRIIRSSSVKPNIGEMPYGGPENSPITFVMVCRQGFDIHKPNANSTFRLGLCRGFAQIGVRYHLVSVWELNSVLPSLPKPLVFLSVYDYLDMDKKTRILLRKYPHLVWGHANLGIMRKAYKKFDFDYVGIPDFVYKRVAESEPNFIASISPKSALDFFSTWLKYCPRVESLPLACDTTRYFIEEGNGKYSGAQIAFVGGYWKKKAFQFEKYLKPHEGILQVYGYNQWPYKGYQGLMPDEEERLLYQNACVSPAISEPHAEVTGDIVERVFKIMGSGGLAVTDVVSFYHDLFEPDELLVPSSVEEYHEMIRQSLDDVDFNLFYRQKGYKAVMARHTYAHRARSILSMLDIKWETDQAETE